MDEQKQKDQLKPIYNRYVPIQDIALNIFRERWVIETGGERGSGRNTADAADDDDEFIDSA